MKTKMAILQLPTLPMSEAKLDYYLRECIKNDITLVVLGEYVLNSFFKELEKMPFSMIKEQSNHKINVLKKLAKIHNLTIVAPIVVCKKHEMYKAIARATPQAFYLYEQQILINYKHWDEEKFFSNKIEQNIDIPLFKHDGFRVTVISGFEIHFDIFWQQVIRKKVDIVLMPCVGTFDSKQRWNELIKCRAFLSGAYILRANRVGYFKDKTHSWHFYGDSLICSPSGNIEANLGGNEEILIAQLTQSSIIEARKSWGFRQILQKKELL